MSHFMYPSSVNQWSCDCESTLAEHAPRFLLWARLTFCLPQCRVLGTYIFVLKGVHFKFFKPWFERLIDTRLLWNTISCFCEESFGLMPPSYVQKQGCWLDRGVEICCHSLQLSTMMFYSAASIQKLPPQHRIPYAVVLGSQASG